MAQHGYFPGVGKQVSQLPHTIIFYNPGYHYNELFGKDTEDFAIRAAAPVVFYACRLTLNFF